MPSVEDVLIHTLAERNYELWLESWCSVIDEVLGRDLLARINVATGQIETALPPIKDAVWRVRVITSAGDLQDLCEVQLIKKFDLLNDSVVRSHDKHGRPYDKRTRPGMLKHLRRALPELLARPVSDTAIVSRSAVDIWRAIANLLGRRAYEDAQAGCSDTILHNLLLLAGYFQACKLPNQDLIAMQLRDLCRSVISIQGTLVDIVERVSRFGVEDACPRISTHSGKLTLRNLRLSPLLVSLVSEANHVSQGNGFLLRSFGSLETETSAGVEPSLLALLRTVAYRQYEYTTLGFMALSGIEQLLRTFGFTVGLLQGHEQFNNETLKRLALELGGGADVQQALDSIYGREHGNLRNRVLHGAQLHIRRHQTQAMLPIVAPEIYAHINDEFSPQNTYSLCIECLEVIDEAVSRRVTLEARDLEEWTKHFQLSANQIRIGMEVHCDFQGEEGKLWLQRISSYLAAVTPNVRLLFDFGFIGWMDRKRPDRFVLFMALNIVFEALFRTAVRLQQRDVLRKRIGNTPPTIVFRYKMLDDQELCAPEIISRLVDTVEPAEKQIAKEVLRLAVRTRNAVAHGAVGHFDNDDGLAMGHLLIKAIQGLVDAGEHEMIKVAAYFRWRNASGRVDDVTAWLDGEQEVMSMIANMRNAG